MTVLSTVFLIFAVLFGVAAKYVWRDSLPLGVASALATVGCVLIGLVILTRKVGVRL
jgi:hypothetical protein